MWCVNCKTGFDWNTLEIIKNNRIHNPEFFRYISEHGIDSVNMENNVNNNCVRNDIINIQEFYEYVRLFDRILNKDLDLTIRTYFSQFENIIRLVGHVYDNDINKSQNYLDNFEDKLEDLRLQYLKHELDEGKWAIKLQINDKEKVRQQIILETFISLVTLITEYLRKVFSESSTRHHQSRSQRRSKSHSENIIFEKSLLEIDIDMFTKIIEKCNTLRQGVNVSFKELKKQFGRNVPYISSYWQLKYNDK